MHFWALSLCVWWNQQVTETRDRDLLLWLEAKGVLEGPKEVEDTVEEVLLWLALCWGGPMTVED